MILRKYTCFEHWLSLTAWFLAIALKFHYWKQVLSVGPIVSIHNYHLLHQHYINNTKPKHVKHHVTSHVIKPHNEVIIQPDQVVVSPSPSPPFSLYQFIKPNVISDVTGVLWSGFSIWYQFCHSAPFVLTGKFQRKCKPYQDMSHMYQEDFLLPFLI